jgi:hypothetical protein
MTLVLNGTTGVSSVDGSASTPAIQGTDSNTGVFFPAADTVAIATGGSERLRADSSGNVGIGTTSPARKLHVSASDCWISIQETASGNTGQWLVGTGSVNALRFYDAANGNERARIDSSGNLLVGTTSVSGLTTISANSNVKPLLGFLDTNTSSTTYRIVDFNRNGTQTGTISINNTNTTYATSSDYRLKEDVQPMVGGLARVAALKPVTYKWKVDGSDGEGFIAHELAEVVPQAVTGEKDAVETYTDEEGKEQTRPVYQGIDTSFLVATLTAAIQELKAELDTAKARIAALEAA